MKAPLASLLKYIITLHIIIYPFISPGSASIQPPSPTASPLPPHPTQTAGLILPPQGLYDSCLIQQADCLNHLDVLAGKGFKLILNYGQLYGDAASQLAYADRAQSLGMKIIWNIKYSSDWTTNNLLTDYPDLASGCSCTDNIGFITYFVNLVKNHPATWGYYLADEVPATEHDRIKVYSDLIHRLDPIHPRLYIVASSNDPMELFFNFPSTMKDTTDVMGPCYYPYGYIESGSDLTRYTGEVASTTDYWAGNLGLQPAIVLQAFSWTRYAETHLCQPWPDCAPFPSYEQMKAQRDQTLLNSKPSMILWWTYQDILRTANPARHLDDLAAAAFSPLPAVAPSPSAQPAPCPSGWQCEDIGNPAVKGTQTLMGNTWVIEGSGWDIGTRMWERADQFRFVWQNFSGDGEISAKALRQENTNASAKAGLMIRKTSDPVSPYYAVYVTPKNGIRVQYRADLILESRELASASRRVPVFLKISKIGSSFSAYTSSDGNNWALIPHSTISISGLNGPLMAGLAVTSHNEKAINAARFDHVSIGVPREQKTGATTRSGTPKIIAVIAVLIALFAASLFLFRERILLAIGDFLVIQDELQPADVIHVISGEDYRTDYGIQLFKQGYGKQIFFTGGWCPYHHVNHAEHAKGLAIAQGVPPQAIVLDEVEITSTYSETVRLLEFIERSPVPIKSVIVVSDPHHMRRAYWTYRRVLGNQIRIQMAPVPFEMTPYLRRWWTNAASRKMLRDEYIKMVYYIARYQLGWGPIKTWLASFDRE